MELPRGLRQVSCSDRSECLIVLVADVGALPPEAWRKGSEVSWLESLCQTTAIHCSILSFETGFESENDFTWDKLFQKGESLIHALLELRKDASFTQCPMQLICAGLGGIIAKDALQIARQQPHHFKDLLFSISGIIFMSSLHSTSTHDSDWKTISLESKSGKKQTGTRAIDKNAADKLGSICKRFEEMDFDKPVLSVYETRKTTVHGTIRSRQLFAVGQAYCATHSKNEEFLAIESDYPSMYQLRAHDTAFTAIAAFIQKAKMEAQLRILAKQDRRVPVIQLDNYTVTSESIVYQTSSEDANKKNTGVATAGSTTADFEVIPTTATTFTATRRLPRLPCYMYKGRTRNKLFFGRSDELQRLDEALLPSPVRSDDADSPELRVFSLCGTGGVGKTEVATEFMLVNKDKFDAIFWIQADKPEKIRDGFSQIAAALELEDPKDGKDQVVSTNLVKGWLALPLKHPIAPANANPEVANWLLIFDNVDNSDDLNDFWPEFGRGSVLITSRDPLAKTTVYAATAGIDLAPFTDEEAARLLLRLTDIEDENIENIPADALAVAHRLGGLALGLFQMAGVINRRDYDFGEFLEEYNEKSLAELTNLAIGIHRQGYNHTIASVWALELLDTGSLSLIEVISLLDPDAIKEHILTAATDVIDLEDYPTMNTNYQEARADLTRRALITRNKREGELRIHRLTQDAIRAKMSTDRRRQAFNTAVMLLSASWPWASLEKRHQTSRWPTCEELMPHIGCLHELYRPMLGTLDLSDTDRTFAELLTDAAWVILERGGGPKFSPFLDTAQSICDTFGTGVDHILSDVYYTRGAEAAEMNKKDVASRNNLAFLKIRLEISKTSPLGRKDIKLAQAYNQAANAHLDVQRFKEALELYKNALEVFESLDGYEETMSTICVANLGTAYWLQGHHDDALDLLSRNLRAREQKFGVDDTESYRTGRILHVLGNVYASRGEMNESFNYHRRGLMQYRATVGDNHHRTADLHYKNAEHYVRMNNYQLAEHHLIKAMTIFQMRDQFKNEVCRTAYLMSLAYDATGRSVEAALYRQMALKLYGQINPDDTRSIEELSSFDFDNIVCFASR